MENTITVTCIKDQDSFEALRSEWTVLISQADEKDVFLTWEWLFAWWKNFGQASGNHLWLLTVREGEKLIGIAPFMINRKKKFFISLRRLENIGNPECDVSGIISIEPEKTVYAILDYLNEHIHEWDMLELNQFQLSNLSTQYFITEIENSQHNLIRDDEEHYYIPIQGKWRDYYQSLSKNLRRNLKRRSNRAEEMGDVEFRKFSGESLTWDIFQTIFTINEKGTFSDLYYKEHDRMFHKDLFELMRKTDWIQIEILFIQGNPIAFQYGFVFNGNYEDWRGGFDKEYSILAPGKLLMKMSLEKRFEIGMKESDFLRGNYSYKIDWQPSSKAFTNMLILNTHGAISRFAYYWMRYTRKGTLSKKTQDIDDSEEKYQEVAKKATKSMFWKFVSFGGTKALSLVTLFVLAHLLPPENFGLVALATLTMDYFSIISDVGFSAALIQKQGNLEESANITFLINILANAILTLIIFIFAPFAATFFSEPQLIPVLRWLGATFLIRSMGTVQDVLLTRDLNFKRKLMPDLGNSIIKAIISIGLAWLGFGVWSLVIGQLTGVTVSSLLLWYLSPWRPKFAWKTTTAKNLFSYGFSIMGTNALSVWEDNFDYLIIGRIFDTKALGIYTIAYRLPETLVINILWLMTSVLFPAFSTLQDNKDSMRKGFLSTVHYVELLVVPICFGMIITADSLIRVAFGEQWVDAIPILQVISLYTLVLSIGFHTGDVYKAIGRPDILLKVSLYLFPIRLFALWIGAQYSLVGVALGHLAAEIISAAVNFVVARRMINISILDIILELKAFVGGVILLLFALPALYFSEGLLPVFRLVITVIAGGIGYIGTIWFIDREALFGILKLSGLSSYIPKSYSSV